MKSFRKVAAWAMALAITSTVSTITAFAEDPTEAPTEVVTEAPTFEPTEPITDAPTEPATDAPTEAPTDAPTDAPTAAPTEEETEAPAPEVKPTKFTFYGIEYDIKGYGQLSEYDPAVGVKVTYNGSKVTIDGKDIEDMAEQPFSAENPPSDEEWEYINIISNSIPMVDEIVYTDNVVNINAATIYYKGMENAVTFTFGKNVKSINADLIDVIKDFGQVTIKGYKGTAAEKYAKDNGVTFEEIKDESAKTTAKTTTAAKKTTKAAATTAKKNDSPKTGDAGTVTGVLAAAAAACFFTMKKKKND